MQYLIWALEDIERAGNQKAAHHARLALEALREGAAGSDEDEYVLKPHLDMLVQQQSALGHG
jgi:hypothetical protein